MIYGELIEMSRRTGTNSGVRHCAGITHRVSASQDFSSEDSFRAHLSENCQAREVTIPFIEEQYNDLTGQVFWFAQLHSPDHCKHNGVYLQESTELDTKVVLQHRAPNWACRTGRMVRSSGLGSSQVVCGS